MIKQTLSRVFSNKTRRKRTRRSLSGQLETLEDRRVLASLTGQVIEDLNANGMIDPSEPGQAGVSVYIDANDNGALDRTGTVIEPDDYLEGEVIAVDGVSFSLVHDDNVIDPTQPIVARGTPSASTGQRVFGTEDVTTFHHLQRLRMDFDEPVDSVTIDFIGDRMFSGEKGVLEIYDDSGTLLATERSDDLLTQQYQSLRLARSEGDIAYAVAYTQLFGLTGRFDALRINDAGSEISTITDGAGQYDLQNLGAGEHRIRQVVPDSFGQTLPADDAPRDVTVAADETVTGVDFANSSVDAGGSWQNPINPLDVDGDESVVPLDVLLIINEMNEPKYSNPVDGKLAPPPNPIPAYFDVDGDGFVVPKDAIEVINFLNSPANPAMGIPSVNAGADEPLGAALDLQTDEAQPTSRDAEKRTVTTSSQHMAPVDLVDAALIDPMFDDEQVPGVTGDATQDDDGV